MNFDERTAGHELLKTGTLVDFEIVDKSTELTPDKENVHVRIDLVFQADEDGEPEDVVEWAAHGFLFCLAVLSFADARPRGASDYLKKRNKPLLQIDPGFIEALGDDIKNRPELLEWFRSLSGFRRCTLGVSELLGHTIKDITAHYSAPGLVKLVEMADLVTRENSPSLRPVVAGSPQHQRQID